MIKGNEDEADYGLLHNNDVEVAVEQVPFAVVIEKRIDRIDGAQRNFRHHARVKLASKHIHQVNAHCLQQTRGHQQPEQRQRQHHQRRRETRIRNGVDQHLNGNRRCQGQQTDPHAVNDRQRIKLPLGSQNHHKEVKQFAERSGLSQCVIGHTAFQARVSRDRRYFTRGRRRIAEVSSDQKLHKTYTSKPQAADHAANTE